MDFTLACLPVPNFVLLPACTVTLHLGPPGLQRQVELARQTHGLVCLVEAGHYATGKALVGCLAEVTRVTRQATGWNVLFTGLRRLQLVLELQTDQGILVNCRDLPSLPWCSGPAPQFSALPERVASLRESVDPGVWLDMAGFHLPINFEVRQRLLAETDPNQRSLILRQACHQVPEPARCHLN